MVDWRTLVRYNSFTQTSKVNNMARKTYEVERIVSMTNSVLMSTGSTHEFRSGAIAVLEMTLHASGNYAGFTYLNKFNLSEGVTPGINVDEQQWVLDEELRFVDTDDTRRQYA